MVVVGGDVGALLLPPPVVINRVGVGMTWWYSRKAALPTWQLALLLLLPQSSGLGLERTRTKVLWKHWGTCRG